ncbi:MAG: sel1 repeat family protein [Aquincola sp.]|nr:sel1 repeat family protein [Aquincola sp.]
MKAMGTSAGSRWVLVVALTVGLTACQPETSSRVPKPPANSPNKRPVMHSPFTASTDLAELSKPGVLPRNIPLKTFDPHRDAAQFVCRHQAERMAAPTPAAQALHEEAMQLTSPALWPNERNWPRAMQLWQQAADQGHWKAALMWLHTARSGAGENSEKGRFRVEPQRPEVIVSGLERLMRLGLADAFYWMGELHEFGDGVNPSVDRAWAFWELAADLGSPLAQTRIAKSLTFASREQETPTLAEWANLELKTVLLECAHAQGHAEASHLLGKHLDEDANSSRRLPRFKTPAEQYAHALQVLHDGVKYGSESAAKYLSVSFDEGDALVGSAFIDKDRSERYFELGNALYDNPDLRFPNLDRVLPLPPAKLPPWDMNDVDGLIRAAQGVRVTPQLPPQPAASEPGRARIPPGLRTGLSTAALDGHVVSRRAADANWTQQAGPWRANR